MINYHHIGGRNGTYPFPLKEGVLLNDFHLILYDADINCHEQMNKAAQGDWGKVSVYPYCIGGKSECASFNLNFHPTTNSLYPFNHDYAAYGYVNNPRYGEYRLGDACKHLESISLDLYSLEDALKKSNNTTVDFLSLDVQGAEYDILQGAKLLLQKQCLGIQLEVEFVELYSGQKTFFDIHSLLNSMDFELIEIEGYGRCAPMSLPIGYRGLEQPLSAEAIYVKKLDYLIKNGDADQIYKAAIFCLIYKKFGMCIKYLHKAIELDSDNPQHNHEMLYKQLLWDIWKQYEKDREYFFPSISRLFTHEAFQEYYQKGKNSCSLRDKELINHVGRVLPHVKSLVKKDNSSLELLLIKYELHDVAETIRKNRVFEMNCFLELEKEVSATSNI